METYSKAKPISEFSTSPYQIKAQQALPILVRQARVDQTISYSDLALELQMPNPRNLNYVLGSIGNTLLELEKEWNEKIPKIQSLVINQSTGKPGMGIHEFFSTPEFQHSSNAEQAKLIKEEQNKVFSYQKWKDVLYALNLEPIHNDFTELYKKVSSNSGGGGGGGGGGGEGEEHKKLKDFVMRNPKSFGLSPKYLQATIEHNLPSGDKIDVYFAYNNLEIGIEVKSHISNTEDILRGLYQCVKYRAVLEARQTVDGHAKKIIYTFLVLGGELPIELIPLKNVLGIKVFDKIKSK